MRTRLLLALAASATIPASLAATPCGFPRRRVYEIPERMRILLAPVGSHGDVHPFVGIGRELVRDHDVTVLANGHFRSLVEEAGLRLRELGSDAEFRETISHPEMWHPTRSVRRICEYVGRLVKGTYAEIERGGYDLVLGHCLAFGARVAEERLGTRLVTILLSPGVLRSAYETPLLPGGAILRFLPRPLKRAGFSLVDRKLVDPMLEEPVNGFRGKLGLPPAAGFFRQWRISERSAFGLWPDWFAAPQPDWPPSIRLLGFPMRDERDLRGVPEEVERLFAAAHTAFGRLDVLVTGGGRGLGRGIASAFGLAGARVIVHYHTNHAEAEEDAAKILWLNLAASLRSGV